MVFVLTTYYQYSFTFLLKLEEFSYYCCNIIGLVGVLVLLLYYIKRELLLSITLMLVLQYYNYFAFSFF